MCPLADVPHARRTALAAGILVGLLGLPPLASAQIDSDRIDITGRQNLTLGSGARAYGMGGAFLARADDATAASWNPAGLSYLRQPEITLAGAFNAFDSRRGLEDDTFRGQAIDFAAFTWPLSIGEASGAVQVSYQRAISFDGQRSIEISTRPDPSNPYLTSLRESWSGGSDGGFDVVAAGTGLRLSRRLRVGLTVNHWTSGYDQWVTRTLLQDLAVPVRQFDLAFRPKGWNVNAGFMYSPLDQLNLAAVYKTPFTARVRMDRARRDYWGTLTELQEVTWNSYTSDDVRLRFPASFGVGTSWRPRDLLTLSADYTRTRWSESTVTGFFDVFRSPRKSELVPVSAPAPVFREPAQYPTLRPVTPPAGVTLPAQNDSTQLRVGLEYVVIRGRLKVPLRTGYFSDRQLTPNPGGESPRFQGFTAGVGLVLGPMLLDVAYVHESGEYTTTEDLGGGASADLLYKVKARRLLTSIIYRFDSR